MKDAASLAMLVLSICITMPYSLVVVFGIFYLSWIVSSVSTK